jgi:hypothetical protein
MQLIHRIVLPKQWISQTGYELTPALPLNPIENNR